MSTHSGASADPSETHDASHLEIAVIESTLMIQDYHTKTQQRVRRALTVRLINYICVPSFTEVVGSSKYLKHGLPSLVLMQKD